MARDLDRDHQTRWQVAGSRRLLWLIPVLVVLVLGVIAARWLAETPRERDLANVGATGTLRPEAQQGQDGPGAVSGTSGNLGDPARREDEVTGRGGATAPAGANTPAAEATPPGGYTSDSAVDTQVIDLESVLGADPHALIGQHVSLQLPVQAGSQVAFWVGGRAGDRLLVVLERDTRGALEQNQGLPASHNIAAVAEGGTVTVSGRIERLPQREQRYSWFLTVPEQEELEDQGIYLSAESVK